LAEDKNGHLKGFAFVEFENEVYFTYLVFLPVYLTVFRQMPEQLSLQTITSLRRDE